MISPSVMTGFEFTVRRTPLCGSITGVPSPLADSRKNRADIAV